MFHAIVKRVVIVKKYLHVFSSCSCREAKGGHYFGGQLVDKAITATFAALVWHSQEIREELVNNCESCYCMCVILRIGTCTSVVD